VYHSAQTPIKVDKMIWMASTKWHSSTFHRSIISELPFNKKLIFELDTEMEEMKTWQLKDYVDHYGIEF